MKHDVERVCRETTARVKEHFRMNESKTEMDKEIERAQADGFERLLPKIRYDLVEPKEAAVLHCARLIHGAVEALNRSIDEPTLSWDQSRDSVIAGINRVLENPAESPDQNHREWMAYRLKEGWVYGPTKDIVAKTHPCLVPFEELPPIQQAKDLIFLTIVRSYFGL
jgi:hypothetical protein